MAKDENIAAALMDAVRVCSLGQITHALVEVGGQYRRSTQARLVQSANLQHRAVAQLGSCTFALADLPWPWSPDYGISFSLPPGTI